MLISLTFLSSSLFVDVCGFPVGSLSIFEISMPERWIDKGYKLNVSRSTFSIYWLMPLASDKMAAIPIIPIDPANAVTNVRAFFVIRLLKERATAVRNDIFALRIFLFTGDDAASSCMG